MLRIRYQAYFSSKSLKSPTTRNPASFFNSEFPKHNLKLISVCICNSCWHTNKAYSFDKYLLNTLYSWHSTVYWGSVWDFSNPILQVCLLLLTHPATPHSSSHTQLYTSTPETFFHSLKLQCLYSDCEQRSELHLSVSYIKYQIDAFFFFLINLFIFLGCVGSSLLHTGFL